MGCKISFIDMQKSLVSIKDKIEALALIRDDVEALVPMSSNIKSVLLIKNSIDALVSIKEKIETLAPLTEEIEYFSLNYLGANSTNPSTTREGVLYFNSVDKQMMVYDGQQGWKAAYVSLNGSLSSENNLSDLKNKTVALQNLGGVPSTHLEAENPHNINKETVGLKNVDNTADKDKPVSEAQMEQLDEYFASLGVEVILNNINKNKLILQGVI